MMSTILFALALGAPGALAEQFEIPLNQDVTQHPALRLSGPNAKQVARADGQGLRITLPAKRPDTNGVGVETRFRIAGDFEITLTYEILALEKEAPKDGAGVAMLVKFANRSTGGASITRLRKVDQEVFGASRITPGADGKNRYQTQNVPATGTRGKLRLVRTGATLKYLVAEGSGEFREIHSVEVGKDEVSDLQAQVRTAQKPASADVRLVHLAIQADALPNRPITRPTPPPSKAWLGWTALIVLAALASGTGVYFWTTRR